MKSNLLLLCVCLSNDTNGSCSSAACILYKHGAFSQSIKYTLCYSSSTRNSGPICSRLPPLGHHGSQLLFYLVSEPGCFLGYNIIENSQNPLHTSQEVQAVSGAFTLHYFKYFRQTIPGRSAVFIKPYSSGMI